MLSACSLREPLRGATESRLARPWRPSSCRLCSHRPPRRHGPGRAASALLSPGELSASSADHWPAWRLGSSVTHSCLNSQRQHVFMTLRHETGHTHTHTQSCASLNDGARSEKCVLLRFCRANVTGALTHTWRAQPAARLRTAVVPRPHAYAARGWAEHCRQLRRRGERVYVTTRLNAEKAQRTRHGAATRHGRAGSCGQ